MLERLLERTPAVLIRLAPATLLVLLSTFSLMVWRDQVADQHALLARHTEDIAAQSARRFEDLVDADLRIAAVVASQFIETDDGTAESFARLAHRLTSGRGVFRAVALLDASHAIIWATPDKGEVRSALAELDGSHAARELTGGAAVIIQPYSPAPDSPAAAGGPGFLALLPLVAGQESLRGYLGVYFDAAAVAHRCFDEQLLDEFEVIVTSGQTHLFHSTRPSSMPNLRAEILEALLPTPRVDAILRVADNEWQLAVQPLEPVKLEQWKHSFAVPILGLLSTGALSGAAYLLLARLRALRRARERHAMLSRQVLVAQEDERARVARELHDELGQLLTAIRLELGWLKKRIDAGAPLAEGTFDEAVKLVERAADESRRICRGLRPPLLDDLGLAPAVRLLCSDFEDHSQVRTSLLLGLDDRLHVPCEIALCTYRIVQESLTNVSRHARASGADVTLQLNAGRLELEVVDNGIGFDPERRQGCGIEGMRERANLVNGTLTIQSNLGGGTRVRFTASLQPSVEELSA